MNENSILIRFASEQAFEKFAFKGQTNSYQEVFKDFLVRKKKLQMPTERDRATKADKLDNVILVNLDRGGEEIEDKSGNLIEANTKVMVKRLPMRVHSPIEKSYNQMQNSLTKIKEERRKNNGKLHQPI